MVDKNAASQLGVARAQRRPLCVDPLRRLIIGSSDPVHAGPGRPSQNFNSAIPILEHRPSILLIESASPHTTSWHPSWQSAPVPPSQLSW